MTNSKTITVNNSVFRSFVVRACGAAMILSAFAVSNAYPAETKQVTRTVTIYTLADAPKLKETVTQICADKAVVLSPKARRACDDQAFPLLSKALSFRNTGIGAEFNTLVRQRENVKG